jgi:predicted GIY-YIG superfamily endonuclease
MELIYIIKLEKGKYYIGKTRNIDKRWEEHLTGNGSGWTKKYKPLSLITTIKSTSQFDEDKYVKEYMAKYGIDNVRGGTYSNIVLDANSIAVLEKEIWHSKNLCTRCGRDSHYIKECYAKTDVDGAIIDEATDKKKKDKPVIRKVAKKARQKDWSDSDNDSEYGSDDDSDSEYGDSEDETMNVLMSMTSGMLKNARKNRAIL